MNEGGGLRPALVRLVIFHRDMGWYPIELPDSDDLAAHAHHNPGTLKISDALTGETLWSPGSDH